MATLCKRTGKTPGYEIQFFDTTGRRLTIYLGGRRYTEKTARKVKEVVEDLIYDRDNPRQTSTQSVLSRIADFSADIQKKLVKAGLVDISPEYTVKELWDAFLKQKTGIKESTTKTYETAQDRFFAFFKGTERLTDLKLESMQQWKTFLRTEVQQVRTGRIGLVESTVAGTITKAKAVFNWGVSSGWIAESPLKGLEPGSFINEDNEQEIEPDDYYRLLEFCPCQEWRCILALARIGGLRAPSEVMSLRWKDIRWNQGEFTARSPKTEHHEGKTRRIVPLFPALRVELEALRRMVAGRDDEFVIVKYPRREDTNLGRPFSRIVQRAGLDIIKRPFDNMRMCRSNEIECLHGSKCETAWIGHSSETAKKHYLRALRDDLRRALDARAANQRIDWASFTSHGDYEEYVESCRENTPKNDFPALEKIFPATIPAVRNEIEWNGSESKKETGAAKP